MPDILETLKSEHDVLRSLFERMNATSDDDTDTRKKLLHEIESNLIPHAKWEELVFYPAFAKRASHDELLQHAEAIQEHRAVELTVLPDLHAASTGSRQFAGSAKVLSEFIDHHAEEEEEEMFSVARRLFSAEERADLDAEYAKWKDSSAASAIEAYAKTKTALKSVLHSPSAPG